MGPNRQKQVMSVIFRNTLERKAFVVGLAYSTVAAAVILFISGSVFTGLGRVPDSITHTYIAASIVKNGAHSKFANLGTVWLPLFHLLLLPFTLIKPLYSTGLVGTVVNGIATGGILVLLTRIVTDVTDRRDVLYGSYLLFLGSGLTAIYAATPMTEQVSLFFGLGAIYFFSKYWNEENMKNFVISAAFILPATLTRYEFWFVAAAFVVVMGVKEIRSGRAYNLAFFHLPLWGGAFWVIWNTTIFGDPTYFIASKSMPVSVVLDSTLSQRVVFLGILLIIGGGTFLLPFLLDRENYSLAIGPAVIFGMYAVAYLFGFHGFLSNLRYGYVIFGMALPSIIVLRRINRQKAMIAIVLLTLSAAVSSGLVLSGVYADALDSPGGQELNANQAELPNSVVLYPLVHQYDMDYYPKDYLDSYDGQEWISASKAPWNSNVDYVVIPSVGEDELRSYRNSGPNKGIVWNFNANETWRSKFQQHFKLVDPEQGVYKKVNASADGSAPSTKNEQIPLVALSS